MNLLNRSVKPLMLLAILLWGPHSGVAKDATGYNRVVDLEAIHLEKPSLRSSGSRASGELNSRGLTAFDGYRQRGASSLRSDTADASAQLRIDLPEQGYYRVYAWWPQLPKDLPAASVQFRLNGQRVEFDQATGAGQWQPLGQVGVFSGSEVLIEAQPAEGAMLLDAFRLEYLGTAAAELAVASTALPLATAGSPYSTTLEATGGHPPYRWQAVHGLPAGLTLDPENGQLSGIPRDVGSFELSLQLTDAAGAQTLAQLPLEVLEESAATPPLAAPLAAGLHSPSAQPATANTSLLDEVQAMPEGTWLQVSENQFSDVWTPADLRPLNGPSNPTPSKIILAWSSFAWNHVGGNMWLYGGGHANYSGNDTYIWRAATRRWERSSLPSEIVQDDLGNWRAIDGVMAAPSSAHTYDNSVYLEQADRFMTYGGAAYNNGGAYMLDEGDNDRPTGPYVFDPAQAHPMKVGGTTGSHVQRVSPHPEVVGGNMWQNRDLEDNLPGASLPIKYVSGTTYATVENGHDVVYVTGVSGGTAQQLYKHTIRDIDDPASDTWQKVGRYWEGFTAEGAGALDAGSKVYVRTANTAFTYWDLSNPGPDNRNKRFTPQDLTGGFNASKYWGLDYSPANGAYYLWRGHSDVWRLNAPEELSPNGWTLVRESDGTSPAPDNGPGTGVLGKWKFARNLNAFIGLQDSSNGEVWIYKPLGWAPPSSSSNLPPQVSISAPSDGSEFSVGSDIVVIANASDPDGSVARLDFYAGPSKLGEDSSAPWSFTWRNAPAGSHLLTVIARDDDGASTTSEGVAVTVAGNATPSVDLTAPLAGSTYIEGDSIELAASASDADGTIASVQFFAGTILLGEDTSAPYGLEWTDAAIGSHDLLARAFDNEGASSDSAAVTIEVQDSNLSPEVTLSSPLDGSLYESGDTISLAATASDADGSIEQVDFLWGGAVLFSASTPPYQYDWHDAPAGVHSITALAIDNEGAETLSTTVNVEVRSADGSVEVVLQEDLNGYNGTRDTFLSYWHDTNAQGHRGYFKDRKSRYVALIGFNIFNSEGGPVPDGATIQSATLGLYKYSFYGYEYQLNRLLVDWQENQATWQQSNIGVPWSVPGAGGAGSDYDVNAAAHASIGWSADWLEFDLTTSVQAMSSGVSNHGWRLGAISGNGNEKKFRASEYDANSAQRPRLVINYTLGGGNLSPSVSLSTPVPDSSFVEGEIIALAASASDPDGSVASVQFFAGSSLLGEDMQPPFSIEWSGAPVGEHSLTARVFDDEGASSVSAPVVVEVLSDNAPPSVSLTEPLDGAEFYTGDSVLLTADASDPDGSVVQVDFLLNGAVLASDTSAPYSHSWADVPAGSHSLSARVVDDEGATSDSDAVTINVTSPDGSVTVTLQQGLDGYGGSADTYLSYWHPSYTQGHRSYIRDRESRYVPLVKFAIFASEGGPVPDGAIIESAVLSLYKYSSYNYSYRLNRLLVHWEEDEATWQQSSSGVPWAVAGAGGAGSDYNAGAAASASIGWSAGWLAFDITASVQEMSSGIANHGWRLGPVSGNGNTKKFHSSEFSSDPNLRPRLLIRYR